MSEGEFDDLFTTSQFASMTQEEEDTYFRTSDNQISMESAILAAKQEGVRKGIRKGRKEGIEEGMQKGKTEAKTEFVHTLLSMGFPIDKIAQMTKLSIEQVKQLI